MEIYRGMDRDFLSEAYNNRAVVPDWQDYMADWETRSVAPLFWKALFARPVL